MEYFFYSVIVAGATAIIWKFLDVLSVDLIWEKKTKAPYSSTTVELNNKDWAKEYNKMQEDKEKPVPPPNKIIREDRP